MSNKVPLEEFPTPRVWGGYSHLNNVARCWLVIARAFAAKGDNQKALEAKNQILKKYLFAQHWNTEKGFIKLAKVAELIS